MFVVLWKFHTVRHDTVLLYSEVYTSNYYIIIIPLHGSSSSSFTRRLRILLTIKYFVMHFHTLRIVSDVSTIIPNMSNYQTYRRAITLYGVEFYIFFFFIERVKYPINRV